ncbi:MAG: lipopolysaccharide biosynthesis protein RfbH [Candidatus Micrarchaeota archaeon]|nr:lipopolysaccharide biosynthesis protein RfbH [Candidatus Micrarchaeota archaeon]
MDSEKKRQEIIKMVKEFYQIKNDELSKNAAISVPVSGKIIDSDDIAMLVDAALDGWLTAGRFTDLFETKLAEFFGLKYGLMVNSGSSANLIALSAFTSRFLGEKRLKKGEEVITTATSFPTTVNPIFQNSLVPVFLDVELDTYNIDLSCIEEAITDKTRAVMVAHTLGNPFDVERLSKICKEHNLFLIEDCCDAFGATFHDKMVGTFGDFATLSFYPAHHITTGEGGAVLTNNPLYKRAAESMRDWGRDCWCKPGCDNTCGKRFGWKLGNLPYGYDHKYIYSNIGYNLKATDMQAALGLSQLDKIKRFIQIRRENFRYYFRFFQKYSKFFVLPRSYEGANPSPFGYLIIIKEDAPFSRNEFVAFLEKNKIATRMLFGGNIIRQPAYACTEYRIVGDLKNADYLMNNSFWIGVWPGIDENRRKYVGSKIEEFLAKYL